MVREILEILFNFIKSRIFIAFLIMAMLSLILLSRVFELQIVNADEYVAKYTQKTEKTRYYESTRGNIYDSKGNLLAYNVSVYSVVMEDKLDSSSYKNEQMNEIIHKTIEIIEKNGDSIDEDFAIDYVNGQFIWSECISENSRLRFLRIYSEQKLLIQKRKSCQRQLRRKPLSILQGKRNIMLTESFIHKRKLIK